MGIGAVLDEAWTLYTRFFLRFFLLALVVFVAAWLSGDADESLAARPELTAFIHDPLKFGYAGRRLGAILNETRLRRVLTTMLDEQEFPKVGVEATAYLNRPDERSDLGDTWDGHEDGLVGVLRVGEDVLLLGGRHAAKDAVDGRAGETRLASGTV